MIRKSWTVEAGQLVCRWSAAEERTDSTPSELRLTSSTAASGQRASQTPFPEVALAGGPLRRKQQQPAHLQRCT
jgi:hypothetical protein